MKVFLDARKLGDGGIGVYIESLVDGLLETVPQAEITLLLASGSPYLRSDDFEASAARWARRVAFVYDSAGKYSAQEYLLMPLKLSPIIRRHDLFHAPHYTLPYVLPVPSVVTVHDVIHLTHPRNRARRFVAERLIGSALGRATAILTVSEESRREIRRQTGTAREISVVPNALRAGIGRPDGGAVERCREAFGLPRSYFVAIGSGRPHKGLSALLAAWELLAARGVRPNLVVAGSEISPQHRDEALRRGLEREVRFVGPLSVPELSAVYAGSTALVLPSSSEGFGYPALEAAACGANVITTPLPSVREIGGDSFVYARGFDAQAIADAVREVFCGERRPVVTSDLRRFSLGALAQGTVAVYAAARASFRSGERVRERHHAREVR